MNAELADARTRSACAVRPFPRLSDEEVVALTLNLLRDPRAWAAAGFAGLPPTVQSDAARRAARLLHDALATV
jgi:hypothetical protein